MATTNDSAKEDQSTSTTESEKGATSAAHNDANINKRNGRMEEYTAASRSIPSPHRRGGRKKQFPLLLFTMLNESEWHGNTHIVSWSSDGRSFFVLDQTQLVRNVLPRYFGQTKWTSFQRQLNLYGFRRIDAGPYRGAYYNDNLQRDRPDLFALIERQRVGGEADSSNRTTIPQHIYTESVLPAIESGQRNDASIVPQTGSAIAVAAEVPEWANQMTVHQILASFQVAQTTMAANSAMRGFPLPLSIQAVPNLALTIPPWPLFASQPLIAQSGVNGQVNAQPAAPEQVDAQPAGHDQVDVQPGRQEMNDDRKIEDSKMQQISKRSPPPEVSSESSDAHPREVRKPRNVEREDNDSPDSLSMGVLNVTELLALPQNDQEWGDMFNQSETSSDGGAMVRGRNHPDD